jgi:heme exporter protein B
MKLFARQVFLIFKKDVMAELRRVHHLLSVLLFAVLLLLLFSFALSVDPELMRKMSPGLFWLAIFFSSILTLGQSFQEETSEGQWEGLLLLGADPKALFLGKLLGNLFFVTLLQIFILPLLAILFDQPLNPQLGLVLLLGSLGIATLGTFYAGLTATFREGQVLLPLLLFPMLVPVLLCAVSATTLVLARDLFGQQVAWLKLLIVFDTIFLLGSLICADFLFE